MTKPLDAVVVGAGPNGLSAALVLARAGHSVKVIEGQTTIGGGTRTMPLTLPGFAHDLCSAIHPLAAASPFFSSLDLAKHGVEFVHSAYPLVHPLDGGRAAVLHRNLDDTAAGLGVDERAYRRLMKPLVDNFEDLKPLIFNPLTKPKLKSNPLTALRFGVNALKSAVDLAGDEFEGELAKALFAGCAAHSFCSLREAFTGSFGLVLAITAHAVGWPFIRGGSQKLPDALSAMLREFGAEIETGHPVSSLNELPESRLVLFDTHAEVMARVCGEALPEGYRRSLAAYKRSPGVFKIDYALSGPVPWASPSAGRAATVHLGGTLDEVAQSEAEVARGLSPKRPYVLCAQHSSFDDSRAPRGQHTFWAYCHVPNGSNDDMTEPLEAQIERFAPGFTQLILKRAVRRGADLERSNASLVGGDISGGSVGGRQLFVRPTWRLPYTTPNPRVLLCSSSSPPGPGVHGMCGYWAGHEALRRLRS